MLEKTNAYDTPDYPKDPYLHSMANKKVIGKIKYECARRPILEYVGLRQKLYSILEDSRSNIEKSKGSLEVCCEKTDLA